MRAPPWHASCSMARLWNPEPVREIEKLYVRRYAVKDERLAAGKPISLPVSGELFDIRASFDLGSATSVGLDIGGNRIVYDVKTKQLQGADLAPVDGEVEIRVLVDRPMLETIGNRGRVYITSRRAKRGDVPFIRAFAEGGAARLVRLEAELLKSIWR